MTINLINPAPPEAKVSTVWQRSSRIIECIFCEMKAVQRGDSPLCSNCLIDPVQTRTALYLQMNQIERNKDQLHDAWLALAAEHADDWDRLRTAERTLSAPDFAARCEAHRKAGNTYGKLLDAHAAYLAALQPLDIERARLERAERVLEGLV